VPDLMAMGKSTQAKIDAIVQRTRDGGAEIVGAFENRSSAFHARGTAAIGKWLQPICMIGKQLLPCAAHLTGQFGVKDLDCWRALYHRCKWGGAD